MQYRLKRRFLPWIVLHMVEYWYYYIAALGCLYSLHYFSSEIPLLAKNLGDMAMGGRLSEIKISDFIILAAAVLFFRTFSRLLFFYPARIQQRNLRLELVDYLETSPPRNYKSYNEGQIFQTLYNDLNRIRGFMGFALLQFGNIIIAGLIFVPKVNSFNQDFLIAFSPLVVSTVLLSIMIYLFQPFMSKQMDLYGEVQNFLLETYSAKKTIQNYHSEKSFYELFQKHSKHEMKYFFLSTLGRVFSIPFVKLGIGASLIWAALIVKNNNLEASDLIYFSSFLFLIIEPLMFLSWIGVVTSQGYAAWSRIKNMIKDLERPLDDDWLLDEKNDILKPRLPLWGKILELKVVERKWTAIIGETGSGKSYLLEKYAELLNKQGKRYSFIHQEPYLYNDTIEGNIFLGQKRTEEKIELAKLYLEKFGLDVLSESLDSLLGLELGENGKRVSGGQAKRIALIRSIVSDVDYILWDDPFSSVDLILENQIINYLKSEPALRDKTFVLSSHRLSTIKACHDVILINSISGLVEQASIEDSFKRESRVSEFFQKQLV